MTIIACQWNSENVTCTRRQPPDFYLFYLLCGLGVTLFCAFCDHFLVSLLNICFSRPILEDIGLNSLEWLGAPAVSMPSTRSGQIASTLIGTLLKDIRAHILLTPSPNRTVPDGNSEEEETQKPVVDMKKFTEAEKNALAFMSDKEENARVTDGSETIAEMMRKLRGKLTELNSSDTKKVIVEDEPNEQGHSGPSRERKPWDLNAVRLRGKNEFGGYDYDSRFEDVSRNAPQTSMSTMATAFNGSSKCDTEQNFLDKLARENSALMMARYCYYDVLHPKEEMRVMLREMRTLFENQVSIIPYVQKLIQERQRLNVHKLSNSVKIGSIFGQVRDVETEWQEKLERMSTRREVLLLQDFLSVSSFAASVEQFGVMSWDGSPRNIRVVALPSPMTLINVLPFPVPLIVRLIENILFSIFSFMRRLWRCFVRRRHVTTPAEALLKSSAQAKSVLLSKLEKSRQRTSDIVADVESYAGKASIHDDIQDMRLLQHFILEQIPSSTIRFAVDRVFAQAVCEVKSLSHDPNFHSVRLWKWLISNMLLLSGCLAGIIYVLNWFFSNNQIAVRAWFITLGITIGSDIFVYKTSEVFMIHLLAFDAVKPQLKIVLKILREIIYQKFRTADDCNRAVNPVNSASAIQGSFSPSARIHASRSTDLDLRVVQHVSGACRAARQFGFSHLPSAQLLMRLNDIDALMLKKALRGEASNAASDIFTDAATKMSVDDTESLLDYLWGSLSPQLQHTLFTVLTTCSIPIAWTGLIILGYFIYVNYVFVYVFIGYAIGAYIAAGFALLYPSHLRVRAFVKTMIATQALRNSHHKVKAIPGKMKTRNEEKKRGKRASFIRFWWSKFTGRRKRSTLSQRIDSGDLDIETTAVEERDMKSIPQPTSFLRKCAIFCGLVAPSPYRLSGWDRLLIWLGLVRAYAPPLSAEQALVRRFWTAQWAFRVQGSSANNADQRSGSPSPDSEKKHYKGSPRAQGIDVQPTVRIKLPHACYALHSFSDDWGKKWSEGSADSVMRSNTHSYSLEQSPALRSQYVGGDYSKLVVLHNETMQAVHLHFKHQKAMIPYINWILGSKVLPQLLAEQNVEPLPDVQGARNFVADQFEELGNVRKVASIGTLAGSGLLAWPQLLQVSYRLFIRYLIDQSAYLSRAEWLRMADDLKARVRLHEKELMTASEYTMWMEEFVNETNELRAKDRRAALRKLGEAPMTGPVPLSLSAMPVVSDAARTVRRSPSTALSNTDVLSASRMPLRPRYAFAPTHDSQEAMARLRERFQVLDPLDSGWLSAQDGFRLAQWIWSVYSPCGYELHAAEVDEVEEDLLALIEKRMSAVTASQTAVTSESAYPVFSDRKVISLNDMLKWFQHSDNRLRTRRMKGAVYSAASAYRSAQGGTSHQTARDRVKMGRKKNEINPAKNIRQGLRSPVVAAEKASFGNVSAPKTPLPVPARLPFPLSTVATPALLSAENTNVSAMKSTSVVNQSSLSGIETSLLSPSKKPWGVHSMKLFSPEKLVASAPLSKLVPKFRSKPNEEFTTTTDSLISDPNADMEYKLIPVLAPPTRGVGSLRSPVRLAVDIDDDDENEWTKGKNTLDDADTTQVLPSSHNLAIDLNAQEDLPREQATDRFGYILDLDNEYGPDSDDEDAVRVRMASPPKDIMFQIPPKFLTKQGTRKKRPFASPAKPVTHSVHAPLAAGNQSPVKVTSPRIDRSKMAVLLDDEPLNSASQGSGLSASQWISRQANTATPHSLASSQSATASKGLVSPGKSPSSHVTRFASTPTMLHRTPNVLRLSMRLSPISLSHEEMLLRSDENEDTFFDEE